MLLCGIARAVRVADWVPWNRMCLGRCTELRPGARKCRFFPNPRKDRHFCVFGGIHDLTPRLDCSGCHEAPSKAQLPDDIMRAARRQLGSEHPSRTPPTITSSHSATSMAQSRVTLFLKPLPPSPDSAYACGSSPAGITSYCRMRPDVKCRCQTTHRDSKLPTVFLARKG